MNIQCMSAQTHLFQDHLVGLGWQLAALRSGGSFLLDCNFHLTVRAVSQLLFSYLTEVQWFLPCKGSATLHVVTSCSSFNGCFSLDD